MKPQILLVQACGLSQEQKTGTDPTLIKMMST